MTDRLVAIIRNTPAVHGVLAVPSLEEVFATATGTDTVDVISEKTLRIDASAPAGVYPDGMTYDPRNHQLFISDEQGSTETVIDTRTNRRVATIAMGGKVGNSQYDPVSGMVFADVQTRNQIVEIDPKTHRIIRRIPLPPACRHDHGLLLDPASRVAFVACDGNARLLVLSMPGMRTLSVHRTGDAPDVLAFDARLQRLYVASESGVVAVFHVAGTTLQPIGRARLAFEAHVVAVDPSSSDVYFPLQNVRGRGVLRIMAPEKH